MAETRGEKLKFDISMLQGFKFIENGQSNLSGPVLRLFQSLERFFLKLAGESKAEDYQFPTFIRASELAKLDYFRSFPHLVTFPVALDRDPENIREFMSGKTADASGELHLTKLQPVCDCLTPAACYHFYIHHQGEKLSQPRYMTTRANCYRREEYYLPLQRQWNFNMREVVCLGSADEVREFIERHKGRVKALFEELGLPIRFEVATDPFFDPTKNPKFIMQTLDPVKTEMIFGENLSIGSFNYHRNYFGEAFRIERNGEDAHSGCVAFGMERWIFAVLNHFGTEESRWPAALRG